MVLRKVRRDRDGQLSHMASSPGRIGTQDEGIPQGIPRQAFADGTRWMSVAGKNTIWSGLPVGLKRRKSLANHHIMIL